MATSAPSFSVFPPSQVPRIALPNPHNRKPSLSKDIVATTESRVIKLEENPVPKIPSAHLAHSYREKTPTPPLSRSMSGAVRSPETVVRRSSDPRRKYTPRDYKSIPRHSPEAGSIGSLSTLVRSTTPEGRSKSPVVPIRSMFPVYNPSVPLAGQNYHPQRPTPVHAHVPTSKYSRQDLRTYMTTPIDIEVGAKTAPTSVADIPLHALQSREAQFSSPRALERLWDATHGTEPTLAIGAFDLEMARTSEATFTFGSDPSKPFYSVATYDTNEIAISKTCPRKRTVTCDVALASIESMERRVPPEDGLVTFIFPKMAAMLAINQSSALADEYGLAPAHRDEVQATAIKRAANQEASYLRYNFAEKRYELEHPAITRSQKEPNFIMSPQTPAELNNSVLHITVNQTTGQTSHGKPSITVTCPATARTPSDAADAGIRLSTMGQSEGNCSLASLDFHSNTLHIDAYRILELMPSLFAVDSLVSAIVAVAIADPSTNVVMGSMDLWYPPPKALGTPTGSTAMSWGTPSVFYATSAERVEAETQAKAMQQGKWRDANVNRNQSGKSSRSWFGRNKTAKQKQAKENTKKITIEELDLEKLGHYQGGDRKGEELPAITRTLLSLLIGGLKLIVWILTVLVKLMAWILVHATRCFTSEKF